MHKITRIAFTLAEVLITLAIIGVVAALTIPSVVNNYREKQVITVLKKNYSVLNNAYNLAIAQYGDISQWGQKETIMDYEENDDENIPEVHNLYDIADRFMSNLKIGVDCGYEANGCFKQTYKQLNEYDERDFENQSRYRKFILNDGTLIALQGYEQEMGYFGEIWIDVNGKKGPNIVGKDMFLFGINDRGVVPYAIGDKSKPSTAKPTTFKKNTSGYACAAWIIQYENMDYLKCDDLEWGKKTKCD